MHNTDGDAPGAAAPGSDEASAGDAARGFWVQDSGHPNSATSGCAAQAALVIEGEQYAAAYLDRLRAGMAHPDSWPRSSPL